MKKESNVTVIKPKPKWKLLDFRELWQYRELFWIFAWRDIKVRYKQTFLGVVWAIFQPLFSMFIFTVFFGNFAATSSGNLPYPLFVLVGLVFWNFFSSVLSHSSSSLVENEGIIKKVYFPREILPLSTIGVSLIDFTISFLMLILVVVYFGYNPGSLFSPIILLGLIIAGLGAGGLGMFLSAVNVKYRDVRYILPFFIQTMVFLTPVIYPTTVMRSSFRAIMLLNPMTGVIEAVRNQLSGRLLNWSTIGISAMVSFTLYFLGLYYFKKMEKFFADIV